MAGVSEIVRWLDEYLRVDEIEDYPGALNGLQVETSKEITRIGGATDAAVATIEAAVTEGCDLLIVHHGLFFGDPKPLTGPLYRRVRALMEASMGLYSVHLPLDMHPAIGNNVLLARAIGLPSEGRFGTVRGNTGVGVLSITERLARDVLVDRVREAVGGGPVQLIPGGPEEVRKVAIVTGGAGSMLSQAVDAGADTFITGEGSHNTYHEALEARVNLIYAGHYATETAGVRTLAERTADRFGASFTFIDAPTGM